MKNWVYSVNELKKKKVTSSGLCQFAEGSCANLVWWSPGGHRGLASSFLILYERAYTAVLVLYL